ncbi:MAG: anaerobic ribonucleoside-triphosphate reductase activating protein [Oscillospiraceae bacterium]|nr:anaerobic ribonucleoside-triphosphate reductase activating protein [Oscillospiraceae bacterium]
MRISGIQKLTLLDYPGTVACTLFTAGCNFRCPFCHNALLVLPERLEEKTVPEEEVLSFLKKRFGILDGVAITGGEPLLHGDMPRFLEEIKALGYRIKLDTNGSNPGLLEEILSRGLVDRVAMDIKNAPEKYGETIGIPNYDISKVERSKNLLLGGSTEYEFRTTVVKGLHTKESLLKAAEWIAGAKEYYLQQFKDSGELILPDGLAAYDKEEMHGLCEAVRQYVPSAQVRGI